MNCNVSGSKCYGEGGRVYDDDTGDFVSLTPSQVQANCARYGRLYDWSTAMGLGANCNSAFCSSLIQQKHQGICPNGWHIPSNYDWDKLFRWIDEQNGGDGDYDDGIYFSYTAGEYLKARTGWNDGGNGTNKYGFSAFPGGFGYSGGSFDGVGISGLWWSASEYDSDNAYARYMLYYDESASWDYGGKSGLFSVRCLQD